MQRDISIFYKAFLWLFLLMAVDAFGQTSASTSIKPSKYLFYFHGQVVTELGDNAINNGAPEWGRYEFSNILDSLRKRGFVVISEIRKKGIENEIYTAKTVRQIDSLLRMKVDPKNIILVGASAGTDIVLRVASRQKNDWINYVIMGGCRDYTFKDYENMGFSGRFLSITEKSDESRGTCLPLFNGKVDPKKLKEVQLNTGLDHGFFYKGRRDWIDPIMVWLAEM